MNSGGMEGFLMLFIILSMSVGIFNAGAARTINQNIEDRIRNEFGSDIVTRQHWRELDERGQPVVQLSGPGGIIGGNIGSGPGGAASSEVAIYVEPPFVDFRRLDGISGVARVMQQNNARLRFNNNNATTNFIAFDPYDFAHTAWWRSDLAPHSFNEYMNIMIEYPSAAILSESLRDHLGLREGDKIRIDPVSNNDIIEIDIFAFVDYWPSFSQFTLNSRGEMVSNHLVVANLEYIYSRIPKYPYDVWIRKMPNVSDGEIFEQLEEMITPFKSIETLTKPMVAAKNDPVLQGTNGALSLGFIIAMLVSGMGFLIYWILSINTRALQFGVFRAMGLNRRKIFAMIIREQLLVSGTALAIGIALGNLTVSLFLPIFSLLYSGVDQSIPFRIFPTEGDTERILLIFGAMLLVCLVILGNMLKRIKIDQVLKLGED